jgi:hypothetical protein
MEGQQGMTLTDPTEDDESVVLVVRRVLYVIMAAYMVSFSKNNP